jgi:hypothetical protein
MVGHKLGEFSFTRKVGKIHEKKLKNSKSLVKKKAGETKVASKKINDKRKNTKK